MTPPKSRFSLFGIGGGGAGAGDNSKKTDPAVPPPPPPVLKLQTDKNIYRPGDPVIITIEIQIPQIGCSLLVKRLSFEIKGIEKLDTQWFTTQKPESKKKRGEKEAETIKRNADVHEIHRMTHFNSFSTIRLPKSIHDQERIIWLGDLNYRINLSYEKTQHLIYKKDWSKLVESDQLVRELRKGHAFDGWSEGTLIFPATYKYELKSNKYYGEDPKIGRRTPAWCDRILSFGKGMRLMSYRRTELKISDHRPVSASCMVVVEVFCPIWDLMVE